nr:hypothetical protein [Coxiella burnetii]
MLFAGALTIDFNMLKAQKWEIGMLASLSTIVSTVLIAFILYYFCNFCIWICLFFIAYSLARLFLPAIRLLS